MVIVLLFFKLIVVTILIKKRLVCALKSVASMKGAGVNHGYVLPTQVIYK